MINYDILTDFANDHSLAEDISVTVNQCGVSFKAITDKGGKCENASLLGDLIRGAEHFYYFLERNGYKIVKKR